MTNSHLHTPKKIGTGISLSNPRLGICTETNYERLRERKKQNHPRFSGASTFLQQATTVAATPTTIGNTPSITVGSSFCPAPLSAQLRRRSAPCWRRRCGRPPAGPPSGPAPPSPICCGRAWPGPMRTSPTGFRCSASSSRRVRGGGHHAGYCPHYARYYAHHAR